jgi:hypothetical protein
MPWDVFVQSDCPVVETRYAGDLSMTDLVQAVDATIKTALQHGISRFFSDCLALQGGHSLTDLYFLAQRVAESGIGGNVREAVLLPVQPAAKDDALFWENAARNRGFVVRVFADRDIAQKWLLE